MQIRPHLLTVSLVALTLVGKAARAEAPPDVLRFVPEVADLVIKVEQPCHAIELLLAPAARPELLGFRAYREALESTGFRRGHQFLTYVEQELGAAWPDLLDRLAGKGIVIAAKFDAGSPPVVAIAQGTDAALTKKFLQLAMETVDQERTRQGQPGQYSTTKYNDTTVYNLDNKLYAAAVETTLVYATHTKAIEAVIDRIHKKADKSILDKSAFQEGAKLLPPNPLGWAWISLDKTKQAKELETLFNYPSNFFPIPLSFGGLIDVVKRSPFVVVSLHREQHETVASIRFPQGVRNIEPVVQGHFPAANEEGVLPPLEPTGVLYCNSFTLDLYAFWQRRKELLPADQLHGAEEFNEASKIFLSGKRFGEVLAQIGSRHRVVVAAQRDSGYQATPANRLPSFAWVAQLRAPEEFQKTIEGPLQVLGLTTGFAASQRRSEELIGNTNLTTYRFFESDKNKEIYQGFLFNFSPCFARVRDQFLFCSTHELGRELIGLLEKESRTPAPTASVVRSRFYWSGLTTALMQVRKQLVAQNILEQGNTPDVADAEVALYLKLLDTLAHVDLNTVAEPDRYRIELRLTDWKDGGNRDAKK